MLALQRTEPEPTLRRIYFRLVATSGATPLTGATVSSTLRKNGAPATAGGTVTELGGGLYYYQASTADLDTVGSLIYTPSASGAFTFSYEAMVFDYAPTQPGPLPPANFSALAISEEGQVEADVRSINDNRLVGGGPTRARYQ